MTRSPTQQTFDTLADKLSQQSDTHIGKFFGFPALTVHGKTFAVLAGDAMVFKLTGDAHTQALALPGAHLWNPYGRVKKQWVAVPVAHAGEWERLAGLAREFTIT